MEQTSLDTKVRKKRMSIVVALLTLFFLINSVVLLYFLPGFKKVPLNPTDQIQIYYMGTRIEGKALYQKEQLYIPYTFIKNTIDNDIYYDENENIVIITTNKEVYQFPLGKKEGLINTKPYSFSYPSIEIDGDVYLAIDPLKEIYNFKIEFITDESILSIHQLKLPIQKGEILSKAKIRKGPSIRSPWIEELNQKDRVYIFSDNDNWYWIESETHHTIGYVKKEDVKLTTIQLNDVKREVYQPWKPIGYPIILSWEYATRSTVDPSEIGELPGLHVLSPTWFHLQEDGLVKNSADKKYVQWAHEQGYQVWGLFSNNFEPELTHEMLSSAHKRMEVIKQLLSYVDLYQLDGINLDFENVNLEDKETLVQFVRELTPLLHEKDRTISMDVTFISRSENWSMFYDREKLSEVVDYMIVMAYDEHWANSPKAGSVASLPWVEKGLQRMLDQVPNDKLILGVPFYTRLWTETTNESGDLEVTSKTLTMEAAQEWIKAKNAEIILDKNAGQHYVEVKEGNTTYKIWLEDLYSMEKRVQLMKKYRLAGIGAWRRGFEEKGFWNGLVEVLEKR